MHAALLWTTPARPPLPPPRALPSPTPPSNPPRLYNLQPPGPGAYHLQFEFGLAAPGTAFYLDDVQACG
jgi:hypothetical protein